MGAENIDKTEFFKIVFDAIPSLIFVVDDDVRVQEYNAAAANVLSGNRETILKNRCGEVLNCLHTNDVPEGCGRAPICKKCIVRNSVNKASQGHSVVRRRTKIEIIRGEAKIEIYALITASPFLFKERSYVLLVIEDISEIAELRRMITICSICKEIRDEKETWLRIESYFKKHWDIDFSHGICPKCFKTEMAKLRE
jgi:PAS domain-containing protein